MRTAIITRGLPASGKSTYAKNLLKKEQGRWKRINRDDLRAMFDESTYSKDNEDFIRLAQDNLIVAALNDGYDVIIDNTHLVPNTLKKLHNLLSSVGDVKVIEKAFNVSITECIQRNAQREGRARVPDKVIHDMAHGSGIDRGKKLLDKETYYPPRGNHSTVAQDLTLPKAIICDLDGTLAIIGDRNPYDATDCDKKDHPNWPVINAVKAMSKQGYHVIFLSGRDQKYEKETHAFIDKYCRVKYTPDENGMFNQGVIDYDLYMRPRNDMRKDAIVKQELFDAYVKNKFNIEFVLDDRNSVVDLWRSIGLTCFQVNYGNF